MFIRITKDKIKANMSHVWYNKTGKLSMTLNETLSLITIKSLTKYSLTIYTHKISIFP